MKQNPKDNPICNQVYSLPDMIEEQVKLCFSPEQLEEILPVSACFDIRKVLITGCGDSLAVAGNMKPIIEKFCDVMSCKVLDPVTFTRYMSKGDIGIGEPNSPLVLSISAGGETSRVVEVLEKASELKAFPLVITNNANSSCAKKAKKSFIMKTPKMANDFPGLRSYLANMIGIISIACRLGLVRGVLQPEEPQIWQEAINTYVKSFGPEMARISDAMFSLAEEWKDFRRFDFIGDGVSLNSALFSQEKFYECTGSISCYNDSEDWCHIDYFMKNPETVGTIFYAYQDHPSYSRIKESIGSAAKIGRPVLVITDREDDFGEGVKVICLPQTPAGFEWLRPLMDYTPAALLAGYISALAERQYFNSFEAGTYLRIEDSKFFAPGTMTLKDSKIEYIL